MIETLQEAIKEASKRRNCILNNHSAYSLFGLFYSGLGGCLFRLHRGDCTNILAPPWCICNILPKKKKNYQCPANARGWGGGGDEGAWNWQSHESWYITSIPPALRLQNIAHAVWKLKSTFFTQKYRLSSNTKSRRVDEHELGHLMITSLGSKVLRQSWNRFLWMACFWKASDLCSPVF